MKINEKYLCIFGGGSVRGFSYIGVQKALKELGITVDAVAGSSIGAVYATFMALQQNYEEIEQIFEKINFELFRDINFGLNTMVALSKGGVFLETLRDEIGKAYYGQNYEKGKSKPVTFEDLDSELIILTCNLTDNVPLVFSKEKTPDFEIAQAVRASAGMPGLVVPFEYQGKLITDGDLAKGFPLWKLDKSLCPDNLKILELRLEGVNTNKEATKSPLEYFNTIYSTITNYSTDYIMDMYSYKDKFDYIKIDTGSLLLVNFNISKDEKQNLINLGYDITMDYFLNKLENKKENYLKIYTSISQKIKQFEKLLNKNNIKAAKNILCDILEEVCSYKKFIENEFVNMLFSLKKTFLSQISENIFGLEKIKEKQDIYIQLTNIRNYLIKKCNSFEDYVCFTKKFKNNKYWGKHE